jgi:N-acetylmuramoyl-L-alanine amidase
MGKKIIINILFLAVAALMNAADNRFTLVIDAGHGGHDAGALGAFSKEKDINLNVALAFGRYVENNCPDVRVVYTRKSDVFVPLDTRADIANKCKADLFVSVHTNALKGGKIARGVETYTLGMARAAANLDVAKRENSVILVEKDYKRRYEGFNPNSSESYIMFEFMQDKYMEKSVELAKQVQSQICSTTNHADKGVHQAGFLVLRCTSMPSCLIELGFITTPDEEQYLNSQEGIDNCGRGIYQAFVNYKSKHDGRVTVPFLAEKENDDIPTIVPEREETPEIRIPSTQNVNTENETDDSSIVKKEPEAENTDPIFKIQLVASSRSLRPGSQQFKGLSDIDCFQEDDMFKYTYGSSVDYLEIYKLRKTLLDKFPQAFIIAFKNGDKMNINEAIREYRSKRK